MRRRSLFFCLVFGAPVGAGAAEPTPADAPSAHEGPAPALQEAPPTLEPTSAGLSLQMPPECGTEAEFRAALSERLGPAELAQLPTTRVTIEQAGPQFQLMLEFGVERRALSDAKCRDLFRAAIVMVVAASERQQGSPSPIEPARSQPEGRIQDGFEIDLGGGPTFGLLPKMAWGMKLEAAYRRGIWGAALSARYLPEVSAQIRDPLGLAAHAFGGHVGGWVEPWPQLRFHAGCVGYRLSGTGLGSRLQDSGAVWAIGPVAGVTAIPFRLPRLWVGVGAEAQLELVRPRFEIIPYGDIFSVSRVVGSIFLRIAPVFP